MILHIFTSKFGAGTCPHMRGDDPGSQTMAAGIDDLSPHAWG